MLWAGTCLGDRIGDGRSDDFRCYPEGHAPPMSLMNTVNDDAVRAIQRIEAVPTILEAVADATGLRLTAIARVTGTQWTACAVHDQLNFGLAPGDELVLESRCHEIHQHNRLIVIDHVAQDVRFRDHPAPKQYGFRSYISIPIVTRDGRFFGTLCGLDPEPAQLNTPQILKSLQLFAQLVAAQLDLDGQLESRRNRPSIAAQTAVQREQFVAMLGHDLRNPLHMIGLGIEGAERTAEEARTRQSLALVRRSLSRMNELVSTVIDFASGEFGGGIPVTLVSDAELADALRHVVAELGHAHPQREVQTSWAIAQAVVCDRQRLAQLLSNLLANALVHGTPDSPVTVRAHTDGRDLHVAVGNGGAPIPDEAVSRLFHPFTRAVGTARKPGLGLGLFIASEIARAHHGAISVASSAEAGITFTFTMPIDGGGSRQAG